MNKREKIMVYIAVGLIIGPLTYFKIAVPYASRWSEQSIRIQSKKGLIKEMRTLTDEENKLMNKFSSLSKKIQTKLPLGRGESGFLNEIEKVARENNILIKTMNPAPFRDLGSFRELSVEIDMEANLGNLVRFLYQLRKSSVVLVANRLRLQPKAERSALLKGHLVISTIFLKER